MNKKMASVQEKAQCVEWFIETRSDIQVQRRFRTRYRKPPPSRPSIRKWYNNLMQTGGVDVKHHTGRPRTSEEDTERIRLSFQRSPQKSVRTASRELQIPRSTVHRVLRKRLSLYPYRLQLIQALQPNDRPLRMQFAVDILSRIDDDNNFLNKVAFSDESTFHVCGKVNTHNVRIWGSTNPHMVREVIRDSPKVNVWCCVMVDRIIGPFFFAEQTVNATTYKDMLELYAIPQLFELQPTVFFQQDGAPPHWALEVRRTLDNTFPARWIGRGGPIAWPPRSPDLTPLDFFLWGFVKDKVYRTRVIDLDDLKARIRAAIASVDIDMLRRVWTELEFRLDVVRATRGAHVEVD